jgi:hypothetical protein
LPVDHVFPNLGAIHRGAPELGLVGVIFFKKPELELAQ